MTPPEPQTPDVVEIRRLYSLSFVDGLLTLAEDGSGELSFKDDALDWGFAEDRDYRTMKLPASEVLAIRDQLNKLLPPGREQPAIVGGVDRLADEAAERMWRVHPRDLDRLGFIHLSKGGKYNNPRAAYYVSEIMTVVNAALTARSSPPAEVASDDDDLCNCGLTKYRGDHSEWCLFKSPAPVEPGSEREAFGAGFRLGSVEKPYRASEETSWKDWQTYLEQKASTALARPAADDAK